MKQMSWSFFSSSWFLPLWDFHPPSLFHPFPRYHYATKFNFPRESQVRVERPTLFFGISMTHGGKVAIRWHQLSWIFPKFFGQPLTLPQWTWSFKRWWLGNTQDTNGKRTTWNRFDGQLIVGIRLFEQNNLQAMPENGQLRHISRGATKLT